MDFDEEGVEKGASQRSGCQVDQAHEAEQWREGAPSEAQPGQQEGESRETRERRGGDAGGAAKGRSPS